MRNLVIVGATSKIAEETAKVFAEHGVNLLLCARNLDALDILKADFKVRYPRVRVDVLHFDARDFDASSFMQQVLQIMPDFDGVLMAHGVLTDEDRARVDLTYRQETFLVNALSVVDLSEAFASYFAKRHAGIIAVIGSVAGDRGRQSNYFYGASKGFVAIYLQGLRNRLHRFGVSVLTIKPGFVDTPMTAAFKKGLLWAAPQKVALGIYKSMQKGRDVVYLPWFWRYIMLIIKLIPERIFKKLSL